MRHFELTEIPYNKLVDITCDKCGIKTYNRMDCYTAGVTLKADAGYGSVYDGLNERHDLCDECWDSVRKFIRTKKTPDS